MYFVIWSLVPHLFHFLNLILRLFFEAPFVPFLTEHMYQNLRHLIDPSTTKDEDVASVHYLILPQPRWATLVSYNCLVLPDGLKSLS